MGEGGEGAEVGSVGGRYEFAVAGGGGEAGEGGGAGFRGEVSVRRGSR